MNPKYPIYIISKGRWESRLTSKTLEDMKVIYKIVVEPSEYENYAKVIDKNKILVTPEDFSKRKQGGIPVRNWVWEHSKKEGHDRHWILDDNIQHFYRLINNKKIRVNDKVIFRIIEDFTDRYTNVIMSGMNYQYLIVAKSKVPPIYINTRIYSCILLSNKTNYKWEGKYNEDTDLSLRILKDKYCTILFNSFLCGKIRTMMMKGGNTDSIYNSGDKRFEFAKSLQIKHPDVVKVVWRYKRWQHEVNYKPFKKNKLIKKQNITIIT